MAGASEELASSKIQEDNQNKARATEQRNDHDRLVESDTVARKGVAIDRTPEKGKTDFLTYSVNGMRKMIMDSDPTRITVVGGHWKSVHKTLSGGDGDGKTGGVDMTPAKDSIAGDLRTAVENVLEHWEGQAAEAFRRRAAEIDVQIRNGAAHANFTAEQLLAIGKDLHTAKTKMADIHEPSKLESAGDKMNDNDNRDDSQAHKDLAAGVSANTIVEANEKNLSLGMERKLQALAVMEELSANYKVYTKNLKDNGGVRNDREGIAPPNTDVTMPPPIALPSASGGGPGAAGAGNKPWSAGSTSSIKPAPAVPRDAGITGGSQLPTTRTNVDSISPGLTGTGPGTGSVGVSGGGGGLGTGGAQSSGVVAGGMSGLGGGAAARGGVGAAGGRGGLAGGAAAGRSAGGRAGMGGMGGGGAGAAGRGGAGAGGRGALARSRGGVVGAAKGVTGKGAGGGAGLHGSRGGTQRGAMAGGAGGAGGRNGRRSEEENGQGDRPDYLVEDEETWISEEDRNRNVPRTIE